MTTVELPIRRTLEDILEDELYHLNWDNVHSVSDPLYFSNSKSNHVMEIPWNNYINSDSSSNIVINNDKVQNIFKQFSDPTLTTQSSFSKLNYTNNDINKVDELKATVKLDSLILKKDFPDDKIDNNNTDDAVILKKSSLDSNYTLTNENPHIVEESILIDDEIAFVPDLQLNDRSFIIENKDSNTIIKKKNNIEISLKNKDVNITTGKKIRRNSNSKSLRKKTIISSNQINNKDLLLLNDNNNNNEDVFICKAINHDTNKPCLAKFSRPYDLTRHHNTIHSKNKIVFHCLECVKNLGNEGYDKTFSRLDALSRHIKSKHSFLSNDEKKKIRAFAKKSLTGKVNNNIIIA